MRHRWSVRMFILLALMAAGTLLVRERLVQRDEGLSFATMINRAALTAVEGAWTLPEMGVPPALLSADGEADGKSARPPFAEEEGDNVRARISYFWQQRAFPAETIPRGAYLKAWEAMESQRRLLGRRAALPRWENIGPASMRNSYMGSQPVNVSGRISAIAVHPTNPNIIYIGAAFGGVWKTTDKGNTWTPLTDDQPTLAVGAIAIAPSNPDVIYVGTGEPKQGLDNYYGMGILKSTDGGNTWQLLGKDVFNGLGIIAIVVHPQNPDILYVASSLTGKAGPAAPPRGIFKSTDGGRTWQGLIGCRDCWGVSDLVMDPTQPKTLYAAFWNIGIFKSTDGGDTWTRLTQGLPTRYIGMIRLGISRSNPQVLYAGFEYNNPERRAVGGLVFKSTDGGASWTWLDKAPNYCRSQCWYDNVVAVHPRQPNTVYLGGSANYIWQPEVRIREVVVRSTDGGQTWEDLTPNDAPNRTLHPDVHAIVFDPQDPNTVWVGTDGGVWVSTDGGRTWQDKNRNLATLQFTGIAVHPNKPNVVFGGMQDNNKGKTAGDRVWDALDVGDGGYAAIDPFNPNIFYGTRFRISFQRNDKGGSAPLDDWPIKIQGIDQNEFALFYAPFALDPSTPGVVYFGTVRLYRSTNRGDSWTAISPKLTTKPNGAISAIAVAPSDPKTIYVGTSDGNVYVTRDGGKTWQKRNAPPLPNRWVSDIAVDPNDARVAYLVYNGFNTNTPDAPGHVFKTTDAGNTWRNISGNLPDIPALSVALDPAAPGTIYIGTDLGAFRTVDDGRTWVPFNNGLPAVPVVDLVFHPKERILYAGTHGRSVYRVDLGRPAATPTPTPTVPRVTPSAFSFFPAMWKALRPIRPTPTAVGTPSPTPTLVGTLLPTATPTPVPTATPTPTPTSVTPPTPTPPPSPRVYYDDFADPNSGWESGTVDDCEFAYVDGIYGIAAYRWNWVCLSTAPTTPQVNGVFEVRAAKLDAADGSIYGLFFAADAAQNPEQFYVFWVDPYDQTYLLQKFDRGEWTDLAAGSSGAIGQGDSVNVLKVRRQGDQITLYVNGLDLATVKDNAFPNNGYVGLALWAYYQGAASATSLFDDFKITKPTVILQDDFSNAATGWPVGKTEACQAAYQQGEYATVAQPGWVCVYRAPVGPYPNGSFQVTARREAGMYPTAYGLFFGEDGAFGSLYAFLVNPDAQEYALAIYQNDGWAALTWDDGDNDAWLASGAIEPGTGVNTLKAVRDGSAMHLFVNDTYLTTVRDATLLYNGFFGLVNWPSPNAPGTAYFDDYRLVAWDEPITSAARAAVTNAMPRPNDFVRTTTSPSVTPVGPTKMWRKPGK